MTTLSRSPLARLAAVLVLSTVLFAGTAPGAGASGTVTLTGYGADSCTAPSSSQMSAFWKNTPFSYWGVYIGGSDRGCSQPNLTRSWVSSVLSTGWDLLPIWVGPQNPCTAGQASYFSTNTSTAESQGRTEAHAAYEAWSSLSSVTNVPITYDLEAPSTNSATCRAAAKAFVTGWDEQLHLAPAQQAGVYTSTCAGDLDDFASISTKPDYVFGADWDGAASTGSLSCVSSSHWDHRQRHKQYEGGHDATYNGVTLNIDSDCADGPVYGTSSRTSSTQACADPHDDAVPAAAAGAVRWHGWYWQAGGPLDGQLQRATHDSPAAQWNPVPLPGRPVITHDAAATTATVGTPTVLADGSLLVPVTGHEPGHASVTLYTLSGAGHAVRSAVLSLTGSPAAGVAAPTALRGGTAVYALDPVTRRAHVWTSSGTRSFATRGLPASPQSLAFSDAARGRAVVEDGSCPSKRACTPTVRVYRTTDGGHTWRA